MSYHATSKQSVLQESVRRVMRRTGTTLGLLGLPGLAFAGPEGGDVIRGAADIVRPDANTTTINQLTDRAIINWQTFNVDANEFVIFDQLDSSSVVLNRVLTSDASYIFGNISANGHVFLLNPNGVFFGEGAVLDVQGFLGSTLDIADDDFMNGNYSFTRADNAAALGRVVNEGQITAGEGGYVVLAGDFTENTGLISAQGGTAALVSGNALTLDISGDGLVSFAVDEATLAGEAGVHNAGSLLADGGMVVMTARVANEVTSTVVNNEGTVRARAIENRGGEVWLVGHGGNVENSGTLDASGENGDGGQMMVWGDNDVTLHDGGVQTVDGGAGFDAGDARFIAREHLDYQANNLISADGATGGMIEVSGHGGLALSGTPNIGQGGELIIDPQHIAIFSGTLAPSYTASSYIWAVTTPLFYDNTEDVTRLGTTWITDQLNGGVDVTLVAAETITWDSSLAGVAMAATTGTANLAMYIGSVTGTTGATQFGGTDGGVFTGGTVTIGPSGDPDAGLISLSNALSGITVGGNFTASIVGGSAGDNISLPDITASNITINAGTGSVTLQGSPGSGSLNATGDVSITGATITGAFVYTANNVTFNGSMTGSNFYAGSSGTLAGASSGNINTITVNGNINVTSSIWLNVAPNGSINVTGSANGGNGLTSFLVGVNAPAPTGNLTLNDVSAGGNVTLRGGNIDLSGAYLTPGTITVAGGGTVVGSGFNFGTAGARVGGVSVNGDINANGTVSMLTGGFGNNINVSGTVTGQNVLLDAVTNGGSGGNVIISGGINATAGAVTVSAFHSNSTADAGGGYIDIGGGITATGAVNLSASDSIGGGAIAGNVRVGSAIDGASVTITADAAVSTQGGRIDIGSGPSPGFSFAGGAVTAQSGFVSITAGQGAGVINIGAVDAAGSIFINALSGVGQGVINIGDYIGGAFTPATITGGANINLGVNGTGAAAINVGTISAANNLTLGITSGGSQNFTTLNAGGLITVNAVNTTALTIDTVLGGSVDITNTGIPTTLGNVDATVGGITVSADQQLIITDSLVTAPGQIDVTVNSASSAVAFNDFSGGAVNLQVYSTATSGITVTTGNLTANSNFVSLIADNIGGSATVSVNSVNAVGAASFIVSGSAFFDNAFTATNNVTAGGAVAITAQGTVTTGNVSGTNVQITANDNLSDANPEINVGIVTATTGNVTLDAITPNSNAVAATGIDAAGTFDINPTLNNIPTLNIGAGGLSAGNGINLFGDVISVNGDVSAGSNLFMSFGSFAANGRNFTAGGDLVLQAGNTAGLMDLGALTAGGRDLRVETAGADISAGDVNHANSTGVAITQFQSHNFGIAGGNITINGDVRVSGVGAGSQQIAALADFQTRASGSDNVTITGSVILEGIAGAVSFGDGSIAGNVGGAALNVEATNGNVDIGGIDITASGFGDIQVRGDNVTIGNVTANVAAASFTRVESGSSFGLFNYTATENVTSGGRFGMFVTGQTFNSATVALGSVDVTAPTADIVIQNYAQVTAGSIAISATGFDFTRSSNGTDQVNSTTFGVTESGNGGGASVVINNDTVAGNSVTINGDVTLSAQGRALLDIVASNATLGNVTATAAGGNFSRSGTINPYLEDDSPFGDKNDDGGPGISEGTITGGGAAVISVRNETPDGTSLAAANVQAGNLSATAPGSARIDVFATNVNAGDLTGVATASLRDGTIDRVITDSLGDSYQLTGTVVANYGEVDLVVRNGGAPGTVSLGNVSATGPVASGRITGATLTLGDLTINASGGAVDITETRTNIATGTSSTFSFDGPALIAGMGISASGGITAGNVNISGPGAAGVLFTGTTVQVGSVAISATDASYAVQDPNFFGGALTNFTVGNALFGIDATTGTVNGNFTAEATGVAHIGGAFTVNGAFNVNAAQGYNVTVSEGVQFLNSVRGDGSANPITLSGPMDITASDFALTATTDLDLTGTTLTQVGTGGIITVSGNNVLLGNFTGTGSAVSMTAAATLDLNGNSFAADTIDLTAANMLGSGVGLEATNINLTTTGGMNLSSAVLTANNAINLSAGTNMTVTNISINAGGTLVMDAGGNISNAAPPGVIAANALSITAGGNINLPNITFNIGSGSVAGVNGDATLVSLLGGEGLAPTSATPNALFSGTNVSLGGINLTGDYLYFQANSLTVGSFTGAAANSLIQLTGRNPAAAIGVEDQPANTATVNYSNSGTFSAFAGQTIAIGSTTTSGNIDIGQNGILDIGSTNFFAITTGTVSGLDKVLSTGIVKDLEELLGTEFEIPQTDEIDVDQDAFADLNDDFGYNPADDLEDELEDEEEGDEEGEDTDDDVVEEEEDDSLISQDTAEEELMCES